MVSQRRPEPTEARMDSMDSNPDLELIAAFIVGRLSAEESARALKLLATYDESLEIFTGALQDQAKAETPAPR